MTARILLVDGDYLQRLSMQRLLNAHGYDVRTACDGDEVLKLLSDGTFDAMITGLRMSGMDAIELITTLKRRWAGVPIIAVSGDGAKRLRLAAARGASAVLAKPYDPKDLIAMLERMIDDSGY